MHPQTNEILKTIRKLTTPEEKLGALHNAYAGETAYILSCGPSIDDIWSDALRDFLQEKLVIVIKQGVKLLPDACDFVIYNARNIEESLYEEKGTIRVFIEQPGYDTPNDIYLNTKIDPSMPYANSVMFSKQYAKWDMERSILRPWGPGVMPEIGIYLPIYLGAKRVIIFGWDMNLIEPRHYYDDDSNNFLIDEKVISCAALPDSIPELLEWYRTKGVECYLCSPRSALPIPQLTPRQVIAEHWEGASHTGVDSSIKRPPQELEKALVNRNYQIGLLQNDLTTAGNQLKQLREQIQALQQEIGRLRAQGNALQQQNVNLQQQNVNLQQQNVNFLEQNDGLQIHTQALQADLQRLEALLHEIVHSKGFRFLTLLRKLKKLLIGSHH